MTQVLESHHFELDGDRELIENLRVEKRELQEKIDAFNAEVQDYKVTFLE
jgi:predicted nuclease with TOPRIM domain